MFIDMKMMSNLNLNIWKHLNNGDQAIFKLKIASQLSNLDNL